MLGYLYGKRFGSKIALAGRKEGDRVGMGPVTEQLTCSVTGESVPKRRHIKLRRSEESIQHSEHGEILKSRSEMILVPLLLVTS
jgi:hypothetical protein